MDQKQVNKEENETKKKVHWWNQIFYTTEFGKAFIPEFVRPKLRSYIEKAGVYEIPYQTFGSLFYIILLITLIGFFYLWPTLVTYSAFMLLIYTFVYWFVTLLVLALAMMGFVYIYYDVKIFQRTKEMEKVLADFLSLFNSNLKTGMTIDKALWRAIKPEFGVLANEIKITSKKVMTGEDVESALRSFVDKYDSPTLKRSFSLITEGLRGGGELSGIIDKVIEDIKKTTALKERMIANSISYTIFISIIIVAIAPVLFALSYYLLVMIDTFAQNVLSTATLSSSIGAISIPVKLADFITFSKLALGVIAFFASLIVSIINKGDIRGGVKYVPAFLVGSYVTYTLALYVLKIVFDSFITSI